MSIDQSKSYSEYQKKFESNEASYSENRLEITKKNSENDINQIAKEILINTHSSKKNSSKESHGYTNQSCNLRKEPSDDEEALALLLMENELYLQEKHDNQLEQKEDQKNIDRLDSRLDHFETHLENNLNLEKSTYQNAQLDLGNIDQSNEQTKQVPEEHNNKNSIIKTSSVGQSTITNTSTSNTPNNTNAPTRDVNTPFSSFSDSDHFIHPLHFSSVHHINHGRNLNDLHPSITLDSLHRRAPITPNSDVTKVLYLLQNNFDGLANRKNIKFLEFIAERIALGVQSEDIVNEGVSMIKEDEQLAIEVEDEEQFLLKVKERIDHLMNPENEGFKDCDQQLQNEVYKYLQFVSTLINNRLLVLKLNKENKDVKKEEDVFIDTTIKLHQPNKTKSIAIDDAIKILKKPGHFTKAYFVYIFEMAADWDMKMVDSFVKQIEKEFEIKREDILKVIKKESITHDEIEEEERNITTVKKPERNSRFNFFVDRLYEAR